MQDGRQAHADTPTVELVGSSKAMEGVREEIRIAAQYDEPALIVGETGTGKELVARKIHELSPRGHLPLHSVNCGAIQEDLLAAELFGHSKGAFTGATCSRLGKFRAAHGTTLFLDEVSETSPAFQVALLRVLDSGEVQPVGKEGELVRTDARIVAATNRTVAELQAGTDFRADVYYRLSAFLLFVPPLRERREDIPELAEYFLGCWRRKYGKRWSLTGAGLAILEVYDYPGNVRELRQIIFSACTASADDKVTGAAVSSALARRNGHRPSEPDAGLALQPCLRGRIEEAILAAEGNLSRAADLLQVPRSTLQHMVARNGIDLDRLREIATAEGSAA